MIIRKLKVNEYSLAVDLKMHDWDEEVQSKVANPSTKEKELLYMTEWMITQKEHNDIRLLYGAFDNNEFLGFIGTSIAEESDSINGIEINHLHVKENHRGKGISIKLMQKALSEYNEFSEVIVYNFNCSPSNNYYRKLGGTILKQSKQLNDQLLVDIFIFNYNKLIETINNKIHK